MKAGGDRQQLHEVIRRHSLAGEEKLLERLAQDAAFKQLGVRAEASELDPAAYVGRAPRQVDEFLDVVLPDLMKAIQAVAPAAAPAEVSV